jgi:hypothetical protein
MLIAKVRLLLGVLKMIGFGHIIYKGEVEPVAAVLAHTRRSVRREETGSRSDQLRPIRLHCKLACMDTVWES